MPFSVLLVDDNPTFLRSAARFVETDPALQVIATAQTAEEAHVITRRLRPCVVLVDVNLRGASGLEATRALKSLLEPPVVIVMTADDQPEYRTAAESAGADAFLEKSRFGTDLVPLIRRLLAGRSEKSLSARKTDP